MAYTFTGIGDEFVGTGLSVNSRSGGSGWYKARLRVKLNSQSVENNTSNITIYFDLSSIPSDSGYTRLATASRRVRPYVSSRH